jgi:hypothetical protein
VSRYRIIPSVAVVFALALAGCARPVAAPPGPTVSAPAHRFTLRVDLNRLKAAAGAPIKGVLVVANPNPALNLTSAPGCRPGFAIILTQGAFRDGVNFTASCTARPFVLAHGISRIPFTVITSFTQCLAPDGSSVGSVPACLPSGRPPPLPAGSYRTAIEWSGPVSLPRPAPMTVVLT